MNYLLKPAGCPRCQEPLQLTYAQRRHARLQPVTILLRAGIIIVCTAMIPVLLVASRMTVAVATDDMQMHWRERGLLFFMLSAITMAGLWLAARMCWRLTSRWARRTRANCECGWEGPCLVREAWM